MESKIIGIFFLVVFSILVSLSSSESNDEEFSSLSKFLEDQRSEFELQEETRDEPQCIAKHHECTHHKDGCCEGKMFKYKCNCYDIEDDEGNKKERCACETPFHHKMAEIGMKVWNKIF
ncbi:hypothetical protein JTE90_009545 [Oedothorax gibbosus]|uniref:Uncharacterized protein n=1 Tax=Oedothorax gibbosus TaxID=931172 RepID=A0AAV6USV8_9ARAC|nr:hypothetical protein JTE90_009545 [Oedothorax gibbosus]